MRTITIKELLIRIGNNDELPNYISYQNRLSPYYDMKTMLCNKENIFHKLSFGEIHINDRVEIEDKKIEELNLKDGKVIGTWENGSEYCYTLSAPQVVIINKINELVKAVNSLKENK